MVEFPHARAIVTDGLWRKSLSAIRALGKAGFRVSVMGGSPWTTGFWSRFTDRRVKAPLASDDLEGFGRALDLELARARAAGERPVVLPMEEAALAWVSFNRKRLAESADFLIPPENALETAQDKGWTVTLATELGIACPGTEEFGSAEEFAARAASRTVGSFVAKPRRGSGSRGVVYGDGRSRDRWCAHWQRWGPMLIQERVPPEGRGLGVSVLMDARGECAAAFAHERLHQYPNSGGPSTDRIGILAPDLVEESLKLLKRLSWKGLAMVEWKVHPDTKRPILMEINPRFWGSLELAVRSGVNFPVLYAHAARTEDLGVGPMDYRPGVRCRWMIPGEILRYLTQPRRVREGFVRFLAGLPGTAEEWDRADLRGAFATLACTGAHALIPRYRRYRRRD